MIPHEAYRTIAAIAAAIGDAGPTADEEAAMRAACATLQQSGDEYAVAETVLGALGEGEFGDWAAVTRQCHDAELLWWMGDS